MAVLDPSANVLVFNAGSSSLKSSLFKAACGNPELLDAEPDWQAQIDWEGGRSNIEIRSDGSNVSRSLPGSTFDDAMESLLDALWNGDRPVLSGPSEIAVIGHRVVHGGAKYINAVKITEQVLADLSELVELAPAHGANIQGIKMAGSAFSNTPQIAVFDTAFHASMPETSIVYPCPYDWYAKLGIRRFGFHGISHQYCASQAAKLLRQDLPSLRMITCHLGNGASLCAIKDGSSRMTTMGYTPLEGLVMGTRSGSIDPGLILHLLNKNLYSANEIAYALNKESGLKGISGLTSDMREIEKLMLSGNARARLAFDIYVGRLAAQIASLLPALSGLDVLAFTGGVGQNSSAVRAAVCEQLSFAGISIDTGKNADCHSDLDISAQEAAVKTLVIRCREDLAIARECLRRSAAEARK